MNGSTREPLIMINLPNAPWESLLTDYYGLAPTGEYLISIIDEDSPFPIVQLVNSTPTMAAIPKFDDVFSEFGITEILRIDNGRLIIVESSVIMQNTRGLNIPRSKWNIRKI